MSNRYHAARRIVGFVLAPLIAPAVVAIISVASGFMPSPFRDTLFPLAYMAVAAIGWQGIPFFFYFFGAPIAYGAAFIVFLRYRSAMERGDVPSRRSLVITSALVGAATLGPAMTLVVSPKYLLSLEIITLTVCGFVAGAAAGWLYWFIVLRPMQPNDAAA